MTLEIIEHLYNPILVHFHTQSYLSIINHDQSAK